MSIPTTDNQMKNKIDQDVTNQTGRKSITPTLLGTLLKIIVDFVRGLYIPLTQKGAINGVPTLDVDGKIPNSQLPAITAEINLVASINEQDDVVTDDTLGDQYFPTTGGKLKMETLVELLISIFGSASGGNQRPDNVTIGGDDIDNVNTNLNDVTVAGTFQLNTTCIVAESTFGEHVNKMVITNIWKTDIVGHVDRLIDCQLLPGTGMTRNTFGGKVEWCSHLFVSGFNCVGDVVGVYQLMVQNNSTCNCKFQYINGTSNHAQEFGFDACTITGNSSSSTFGNNRVTTKLISKTIAETDYPELFNKSIETTIYAKPNGEIWYRWFDNSNVIQFTQIV